jgi:NADH-quinone oxidoreductase subunit B
MFNNYALVAGADKFLPIDVYVPGCPPRPEALMYGILKLQDKITKEPDQGWRQRYRAEGTEEFGGDPAEQGIHERPEAESSHQDAGPDAPRNHERPEAESSHQDAGPDAPRR